MVLSGSSAMLLRELESAASWSGDFAWHGGNMSRLARIVVPGCPHHITQRGVRSMRIFSNDGERLDYLRLLRVHAEKHGVRFIAYCLMPNHIHLVAIPERADSLARALGEAHRLYTTSVNSGIGVRGYLFQGRFYSCPMDERHTVSAIAYVERNPVRAGLSFKAWEYQWSSAAYHTGIVGEDRLVSECGFLGEPCEWRNFLDTEPSMPDGFKKNFKTGRPLGPAAFYERLEHLTGRILRKFPPGRKVC